MERCVKNVKYSYYYYDIINISKQSNLCVMTNLGTQNLWSLLTGGRCSEVALCYEN